MNSRFAFVAAFVMSLCSVSVHATGTLPGGEKLDASVLAEVVSNNGFMAPPGFSKKTTYTFRSNGNIERMVSGVRDFGPDTQQVELLGKLPVRTQNRLLRAIRLIKVGKLVDLNPKAPVGADGPRTVYKINFHGKALTVATRGSDLHDYALQGQKAAIVIRNILSKAIDAADAK